MKIFIKTLIPAFFLMLISNYAFSCTAFVVTKSASKNGSILTAHTDDNELGDQRIIYVPASDHKKGTKRAIYPYLDGYPRYVGKSRGPDYVLQGFKPTKPLGYIPEVKHTYAYIDGGYPIINEHQLAFAETTAGAKISAILNTFALIRFRYQIPTITANISPP